MATKRKTKSRGAEKSYQDLWREKCKELEAAKHEIAALQMDKELHIDVPGSEELNKIHAERIALAQAANERSFTNASVDDGIETNALGGKQSKINVRMDLLDSMAMLRLGRVLDEGARKYGDNNWRKISRASHLNHAMAHCATALGRLGASYSMTLEEELDHAFCRLMMAIATS